MKMIKWIMYAIGNEDEDSWWNVNLGGWVDEFEIEGDCLFPTLEMAQKFIENEVNESVAKVYRIELTTGQIYDYEPVKEIKRN
jgi:hypothetical protein